MLIPRFDSILREAAGKDPAGGDPAGGGPAGDPGGDPAGGTGEGGTGGGAPPAPKNENVLTLTKEQLDERLGHARNGELKKLFGTSDRKEIIDQWKEFQTLKQQQEEAERAKLSEIERYKADIQKLEDTQQATAAELDEMRFDAHISGICARLGVRNTEYAKFIVAQAAEKLPDGEELDAEKWLQEQMGNQQTGAALGIAAPVETKETPAGTSPEGKEPPAPPAGGGVPKGGNAFDLSREQFAAKLAELGVSQGTP